MAAHSKYSDTLFASFCERLANGDQVKDICRDLGICKDSIREWCRKDPELDARYQRAKEDGEDAILEEIRPIADNVNEEATSRKVRIYARLEYLKKRNPKRWGDKVQVDGPGEGGEHKIVVEWQK